jgi:hypothetical protein
MRRLSKYAVGVSFVAAVFVTSSSFAAPTKDARSTDTLLGRLKAAVIRILDFNGMSLPPG